MANKKIIVLGSMAANADNSLYYATDTTIMDSHKFDSSPTLFLATLSFKDDGNSLQYEGEKFIALPNPQNCQPTTAAPVVSGTLLHHEPSLQERLQYFRFTFLNNY